MNRFVVLLVAVWAFGALEACAGPRGTAPKDVALSPEMRIDSKDYLDWISFGWASGDEKPQPLLQMRLPPFMAQEYYCEHYYKIDGGHYCVKGDSLLSIQGRVKDGGREYNIDLSGSAYNFKRYPPLNRPFAEEKMLQWKRSLVEFREIKLDGYPSYVFEVSRKDWPEKSVHRYMKIIYYEFKNMYGDINFSISVKNENGEFEGLPNKDWPPKIRDYLDKIIKSVRFIKKVEI